MKRRIVTAEQLYARAWRMVGWLGGLLTRRRRLPVALLSGMVLIALVGWGAYYLTSSSSAPVSYSVGLIVGIGSGLLSWVLTVRLLTPEFEFSPTIRRQPAGSDRWSYRIRFRNRR